MRKECFLNRSENQFWSRRTSKCLNQGSKTQFTWLLPELRSWKAVGRKVSFHGPQMRSAPSLNFYIEAWAANNRSAGPILHVGRNFQQI